MKNLKLTVSELHELIHRIDLFDEVGYNDSYSHKTLKMVERLREKIKDQLPKKIAENY